MNAGHDLDHRNLVRFRELPHLDEVSIGHAIISRALFDGLAATVRAYLDVLAMKKESVALGRGGRPLRVSRRLDHRCGTRDVGRPPPIAAAAPAAPAPGRSPRRAPAQAGPHSSTRPGGRAPPARHGQPRATPLVRAEIGNAYFDAERYPEAITWYEAALGLEPKNVDVSTDLGVSYYYANQSDRALSQFAHSLAIDPKHTKTMLNVGVVRAFGKQDLAGAAKVWQQVVDLAPESAEGRAARRMIEAVRAAHPDTGAPPGAGGAGAAPARQRLMIRWFLNLLVVLLLIRLVLRFVLGLFQGLSIRPAPAPRAARPARAAATSRPSRWSAIRSATPTSHARAP